MLRQSYVQATRTTRTQPLSREDAAPLVHLSLWFSAVDNPARPLRSALKLKQRHRTSYWDAAIIEAARLAGSRQMLSEDLNPGQHYPSLTVLNALAQSPTWSCRQVHRLPDLHVCEQ